MSVLGTHLCQRTSCHCCERLHWTPLFLRLLNAFAHFMMGGLPAHLLTTCWVFSSFWPKMAWPPYPTLPIHLFSLPSYFFCFPGWKSPQRRMCCWCGRDEIKKIVEVLKDIKMDKFKNCFEQWKKHLDRSIASSGEYFDCLLYTSDAADDCWMV